MKNLIWHPVFIFYIFSLCSCKTNFKISENKLLEYEQCHIYEKEVIVAAEFSESGRNNELATFNIIEGAVRDLVFQIDEDISNLKAEDLPQLYENSVFTRILFIENENLRTNCPELKIPNQYSIRENIMVYDFYLTDQLSNLVENDSTYNFLIVKDNDFGLAYKELDDQGALRMIGKTGRKFIGHIFRTYRVKLRYAYLGKGNFLIPNVNMSSGETLMVEKGCNTFLVLDILNIQPVNLNRDNVKEEAILR